MHIISLLFLLLPTVTLDPSLCSNYYSPQALPPQCDSQPQSCLFQSGLQSLQIHPFNPSQQYSLCLFLPQYSISITAGNDSFSSSLYLQCSSLSTHNYTSSSPQTIDVRAANATYMTLTTAYSHSFHITSKYVWLTNVYVEREASMQSACNCQTPSPCKAQPIPFPRLYPNDTFDYTKYEALAGVSSVMVGGESSVVMQSTIIRHSVIGVYGRTIQMTNTRLSTDGLGYSSLSGPGCGYYITQDNQLLGCSGTGGSHGAAGGSSLNCNQLLSEQAYDDEMYPAMGGSGGGFTLRGIKTYSSGGGVINVQCESITLLQTLLLSNGSNGIQEGGGGAGGAISIDSTSLEAGSIGSGSMMSVQGGMGKSSGAGGRVRLWKHSRSVSNAVIDVRVNGGGNCTAFNCGQRGSVVLQPCTIGNTPVHYKCIPCPKGYFKTTPGYSPCLPCGNLPAYGVYMEGVGYKYREACIYSCSEGYNLKDDLCLGDWDYAFDSIGGKSTMVCILIVVSILCAYCLVLCSVKVRLIIRQYI